MHSTGCLVCMFFTMRQEKCRAVCFPGCFRARGGPTPSSPPPVLQLGPQLPPPLRLHRPAPWSCPILLFPRASRSGFLWCWSPCVTSPTWDAPVSAHVIGVLPTDASCTPARWLCLAAQVHVAPELARLSPAYTFEARKVKWVLL